MDEKLRFELCLREIDQLHTTITWYDETVMRTKRCGIAIWGALSAFAIYADNAEIVVIALAVVTSFAGSELILRRYQRRCILRITKLEDMLASGHIGQYRYSFTTAAKGEMERLPEIFYALRQVHFSGYYGFVAAMTAICAALVLS